MQARLELVAAIGTLYTSLLAMLEASDLEDMYIWAERLARQPMSVDDPGLFVAGAPSLRFLCICLDAQTPGIVLCPLILACFLYSAAILHTHACKEVARLS